jgi:hypothetical protein
MELVPGGCIDVDGNIGEKSIEDIVKTVWNGESPYDDTGVERWDEYAVKFPSR